MVEAKSLLRSSLMSRFVSEKTRSHSADMAGMEKRSSAILVRMGKSLA